ncbi:DUF1831 domain-containing protein [Fructilactobacillus carniphilus]|uniref:DUF1831 domain-containing protein n=1 Tax=Fructilactobacillus carniphilus TaxID=2940297 RepID=A0ABY5BWP1_9LACO|nr:DUF1831 domain-containing protein [Fructilactobacillus carniphilus]USS90907.1 DUF1831 domain-containing protein [Fructilactobacillus carniphilus]
MAFTDQVHLDGDTATYQVNPAVKKYTLSDLNFKKTKLGNYELTQSLNPMNAKANVQLKLSISADLKQLKLAILTASGLKNVDIFKGDQFAEEREQYQFLMQNLIIRQVLTKN